MQISSTLPSVRSGRPQPVVQNNQPQAFQPAAQNDIADIGNSVQNQERYDYGRGLAEVIYGVGGAAVGTVALTVTAAALDFSGWGTAGAGLVGLIAGGAIGGHFGSKS